MSSCIYAHPSDYLAQFTYAERADDWRDLFATTNDFVYVALNDADEIVGFACTRPQPDDEQFADPELTSLHLSPAYRGQGIGVQLFNAVVARLKREGFTSLHLWVLHKNPARHFYERLGGKLMGEKVSPIGVPDVFEVAYAWRFAEV